MRELFRSIVGGDAAWVDLSGRGLLSVTGADRVRLLNGMVTSDVETLAAGGLRYALLLDRKGRIQADLFVLALEDALLLDTAEGTGARVAEALERHVVADDVRIEDRAQACAHVAVEGPSARERVAAAGVALPEADRVRGVPWRGETLLCVGRGSLTDSGVGILGPRAVVRSLVEELGIPALSPEQAEALRLEAFLPRYGVDVTDRTFPAEARLDHAVSETKGCYIGQEIVARIRSRGQVHRLLVRIRTDERVRPGDPICADGAAEGEVTSAVLSAASGPLALGYVRPEHARPGTELRVGRSRGVVEASEPASCDRR
jgi:aminomethyltransferase